MLFMFKTYNSEIFYYVTTFACFVNICIMGNDNHVVDFSDVCLTAIGGWLMACKWSGEFDETLEDKANAKTEMFEKFLSTMNTAIQSAVYHRTNLNDSAKPIT